MGYSDVDLIRAIIKSGKVPRAEGGVREVAGDEGTCIVYRKDGKLYFEMPQGKYVQDGEEIRLVETKVKSVKGGRMKASMKVPEPGEVVDVPSTKKSKKGASLAPKDAEKEEPTSGISVKSIQMKPKSTSPSTGKKEPVWVEHLDYDGSLERVDKNLYCNEFRCECGNVRYVKNADMFQVRWCKPCTQKNRKKSKK